MVMPNSKTQQAVKTLYLKPYFIYVCKEYKKAINKKLSLSGDTRVDIYQ